MPSQWGVRWNAARLEPAAGEVREHHVRKHRVFHRMYDDQLAHRAMMARNGSE